MVEQIPTLDLNDFFDEQRKQAFVTSLGDAFENIGFVVIKNHGANKQLINKVYSSAEQFFVLPLETKMSYIRPETQGNRGYMPVGSEKYSGSKAADLKEWFSTGVFSSVLPPTPWPSEIITFEGTMKEFCDAFFSTGKVILQALALHLDQPQNCFDDIIQDAENSILRVIHYPPITEDPGEGLRCGPHKDTNFITLLLGASADGLRVLTRSGEWIPVHTRPDEVVVNVGAMLERLTNNRLSATVHKVENPPRDQWSKPRYSMPFFLHPKSSTMLTPLASCVSRTNPAKFEPITAGAFGESIWKKDGL